ncbi:hypothetical protein FGKAn22_03720 [Ferrigenium kumadai]|uniref:MvaI/BcnI restriction endonuclease domain-containing protein n=1 Tax=Ferrigenium kumadai TaxID=1682490 RepID=A0AAN1SZQ8_9PROT|nr:MvaI/BcnI family restriction endonuclease [Ferrigenium kumadai]BBI98679.1 hypothetical protein FGKAn22_03720 [Ferrigenium kumadai]
MNSPSDFEHYADSLSEIEASLRALGADKAILKILPRNANDKNQIYFASSFSSLYNNFDLTLAERGGSTSQTKSRSAPGSCIPEAVFNRFSWVKADGSLIQAKNVKVIVYTQYPEARLSGFQTVENTMPHSLSVAYTKEHPETMRLLVLARLPGGACLGLMYLDVSQSLLDEITALPGLDGSRVCKVLEISTGNAEKLFTQLAQIVSRPMKGCRLDAAGNTLPFTGTQVCGYTLEHALGIIPNAAKDGDIYGIELKTHTQVKATLFTPEPDFGLYTESFEAFMRSYGYEMNGAFRVTGIHRAGVRCDKSGLTLKIREYHTAESECDGTDWIRDAKGDKQPFPYDPMTPLTTKLGAVEVVLEDDNSFVAAGWTLERLMNNWGVKHNEVIYIPATKTANPDAEEARQGFEYVVIFEPTVIWCRETSAEHLLNAISSGVIYLDPAPKFVPGDPSKNKRRAQWRVNDITKAVAALYQHTEVLRISGEVSDQPPSI